jgi:hypothetical protein
MEHGVVQALAVHVPPPQDIPHIPQLFESVAVSVHDEEQQVLSGLVQVIPHMPQLLSSIVVSMHEPLQYCWPTSQQCPIEQIPVQTVPHLPQLVGSVSRSVQIPEQDVLPASQVKLVMSGAFITSVPEPVSPD